MHVIPLQGVVRHPELTALAGLPEASPELVHELAFAQRWDAPAHAERNVGGVIAPHRRPTDVVHTGSGSRGSPGSRPCPPAPAALPQVIKGELLDPCCHFLIIAMFKRDSTETDGDVEFDPQGMSFGPTTEISTGSVL